MDEFNDETIAEIAAKAEEWCGELPDDRGIIVISCSPNPEDNDKNDSAAIVIGAGDALLEGLAQAFTSMKPFKELARDAIMMLDAKERIKNKPLN